ncbi:MAG: MFS transporter [candidate division KSB1 bacterium]|nr:MFS transporter [candidate division KSB1 bacterium]
MSQNKVKFAEKISYGLGDTASNLYFQTFIFFLAYFYTDVFGISAAAAGTMFALTRIWDGINDPLMGIIADRTQTRWGKFRPYLLWMVIPYAVIGVLTFTTPNFNATGKLIYVYVTYTLMMMIYTAINIPYSSLMGVVSPNPKVRTGFSQYRFILAFVGGFIVQGVTLPLVGVYGGADTSVLTATVNESHQIVITEQGEGTSKLSFKGTDRQGEKLDLDKMVWVNTPEILAEGDTTSGIVFLESGFEQAQFALPVWFPDINWDEADYQLKVINERKGFQWTMTTFALLAMILFLITFFNTKERVQPSLRQKTSLKHDLGDLIRNVPWVILFFLGIFTLTHTCLRNGAIIYYFKYYVGNKGLATSFMLAGTAATIIAIFLIGWVSNRFGKKRTYIVCMLLTTVFTSAYYFLDKDQIVLIFIFQVLANFTFGPTSPLVWAMYTDAADYSEWKWGRRATGLVMSASTMAQKFGWAIGGALTGWLLAAFGFQANVEQTPETMQGLRLMFSWIPASASLLGAFLMVIYPLSEDKMQEIMSDLDKRRMEE